MIGREYNFIIVMLIVAIAASEAATDLYVPSLPGLVNYFNTDEQTISLTLSIGLFGFCVAASIYGPLSDNLGRRKVLLLGMLVFVLGSFASSLAQNAAFLLLARFIQGLGLATPYVIGVAIVKDLYHEEQFSKIMSKIHMVVTISPALAPIVGGYIYHYFGWQMNFVITGVIAFIVMLSLRSIPETHITKDLQLISLKSVVLNYKKIILNRLFMGYALISGITYAGMWGYISTMPFFLSVLDVDVTEYGYYQSLPVLPCVIGTYINSRNVEKYGVNQMLAASIFVSVFGALCLLATALLLPASPRAIAAAMAIYCLGMTGVFANATTRAMEVFRDIKGSASSALGCIESLVPAAYVCILGYFDNETMLAAAMAILIAAFVSFGLYMWLNLHARALDTTTLYLRKESEQR